MSFTVPFDNSYAKLPDRFYTRMSPIPVREPSLIAMNQALATELGLDTAALSSPEGMAMLAGNAMPSEAAPLAQVYAGHQFGGWSPRLGDGRALLLGEIVAPNGSRYDLQLKGSGPTPYSRMGDGRAWVGPVLREYIVSEAMHALGVPTTRALAAVATGETVIREAPLPGAILTRVASSHIRVGTFQYFASQKDVEALVHLADHAIQRHFPDAHDALGLLNSVVEKQARLIARWMGFGFIHGVMNTDNMTISGETIDYGPCAFMDEHHPLRVFSSIDQHGRYAYARQPDIAMWNLAQLATSLVPLIDKVEDAQASIDAFPDMFRSEWLKVFRAKLGLQSSEDGDEELIHDLMNRMAKGQADFTNTFRSLGDDNAKDQFLQPEFYTEWQQKWRDRLDHEQTTPEDRLPELHRVNPAFIARTHRIEEAIQAGVDGDYSVFERLNAALSDPFADLDAFKDLTRPPSDGERVPQTFCGT
ncbi:MAG: YdiU family protein [Boseongicola sp.]|nr:MAG: YdiU family protein [Boseongicola sp.]